MNDETRALRVIKFIELLKHVDGQWFGKSFTLLNWQRDVISQMYGTMGQNSKRQYQYLYLEIPKKNGKTELAAALGLYHLFADGEQYGEIYGCAAETNQASIAFDVAVGMLDQCPPLKKRVRLNLSKRRILDLKSQSIYQVLSAEAYSKHGYKPSAVIFDELHAQPNRYLWDTMTFGTGDTRDQPVWIVITTAGDDPDQTTIGYEIHDKARRIIAGEYKDPRWLCKIYGAPADADIWDEEVWYQANPSLGIIIDIDKVRAAAESAKQNQAEEKLFRWLRLNQWIDNKSNTWLSQTLWDNNNHKEDMAKLIKMKCYAGLDLSSTTDLTALTLAFPPQFDLDYWYLLFFAWIPQESMKERIIKDQVPYDKWVNDGWITATPGDCVDYDFIEAKIIELSRQYDLIKLATDPWNSRMLTTRLMKQSIDIVEVPQTMAGLSPAMKYMETLLRKGMLKHVANPVARWCFGNIVVAVDGNNNIKPMKNRAKERIDVIVSTINMLSVAMRIEIDSIYEDRGLTIL